MEQRSKHNMRSSRAGSRMNSQAGSRAGSSMSGSIHQARFGSRSFIGSKSNLFSSSRKNLTSDSMRFQKPVAQVFDEDTGFDVTPQSLLQQEQIVALRKNQSNVFGGETPTPNESIFQQSIYGTGLGATSFAQPFSRSMFSTSMTDAGTTSLQSSMSDEVGPATAVSKSELPPEPQVDFVLEADVLTDADLEKEVNITLKETETIWILDIPGTCVALDSDEAELVKTKNEAYKEMVKGRVGNDRYSERGMQTINFSSKFKQIQTEPVNKTESGMTASTWDMYDTYEAVKEAQNADAGKSEEETLEELSSRATSRMTSGTSLHSRAQTSMGMTTIQGKSVTSHTVMPGESSAFSASMMMTTVDPGTVTTGVPSVMSMATKEEEIDPTIPNDHPILKLESLKDSLRTAERAVIQNVFQPKQALYRKAPILKDPDHPATSIDTVNIPTPHLEKLWSYVCPLTKRRKVTCMAWNPANKDLVAIGYGKFSASDECVGLICCWSLKNPEYPERIFYAHSGITSLSFSSKHPNLLAAGLYNGTVALFNARSTSHDSVLNSRDALHKHSGPVWQVKWVVKERSMGDDKNENLVSISVDGRVLQWSIRKGFESTQLMKLKRMITPKPVDKKVKSKRGSRVNPSAVVQPGSGEAYISQHAPGMGFDFSPRDSNIYLVCTEEGFIHKCSCSYNEQVLETYSGHTGPVNRVYWNAFATELFLSCSSDWTVRLWNQDCTTPLQTFKGAQKTINDICWSPSVSTMFGCVSEGRVEIWDLDHSILDPLIVHKPRLVAVQTTITFAEDSEVVLVGNSEGEVNVYLLKNVPSPPTDQVGALLNAIKSSHNELLQ